LLGVVQSPAGHRTRAVEHDDRCVLDSRRSRRGWLRRVELQHDGDLVVGFQGDDIDIEVRGYLHWFLPSLIRSVHQVDG